MPELPEIIHDEKELEDLLSRPRPELVEFLGQMDGDLLILGAGGKIGPSLVRTARRAISEGGADKKVIAVDYMPLEDLRKDGVETIQCDLLDVEAVAKLPRVANVIYMVGRKFGSTGGEAMTWAVNVMAAFNAARALSQSRIVAFSTGCVYPIMHFQTGGATERTATEPVGEYAMSCLARERAFDYFSQTAGAKVLHFRLNYSVELRYGVLVDVAAKVWRDEPVDVTTGYANVIWQGDVANLALLCLSLAQSPARVLNVTGPEMLSIGETAEAFGRRFGKTPKIVGRENGLGYLSNAAEASSLFGPPTVSPERLIDWIAHWIGQGGRLLDKPTHFETQDGKY